MKLESDQVEKPLRKLRKQLNTLSANPRPEEVHLLRTHSRRLEAAVAALVLDREKESRRAIKVITPVRKAAGKVRDMDVLIGGVLTIADHRDDEGLVRLVEHLAAMRVKNAQKLHEKIVGRRQEARRHLKQTSKLLKKAIKSDSGIKNGEATPQIRFSELGHWPTLNTGNLHSFRIRVKELRYMLQLSDRANEKLVERLGEVKDVIGEWHDWVELSRIARKVLDPQKDAGTLMRIENIATEKLQLALRAANQLRAQYFPRTLDAKANRNVLQMAAGF